ncbi:putative transcription factor bHLH family [Helianthus annuus]|uniref:Putative basic helix-loop-helix (BHLH) DNA-binding superfamily protein n=1 Tax=Helianthus annuus TaxID=4232 RepID=A0A251RMK1_HELAN|nr:transcription factor bHLH90 [Helianthus annuus]KAF5754055.1 putative transcription factor bHLH family [Helianthus annuus]KAJ0428024.1 putative transcription factor bHLH family [Helianthus annuus]KAJ0446334.1 putative transcription factor bHLH family [Helianthus annuus]
MKALEWLRPLVEKMSWDYCIVWKFGDDPSRYIEWIGCCCNGSRGVCRNVKEEIDATKVHLSPLCRDTYVKHSVNTNACLKLANIPSHLPLYSGIHGEVALSAQPAWSHDETGTQVLIPVNGGMIELYVSKQVARDEKMIETLMAKFDILSQHMEQVKTDGSPDISSPWSGNSSLVSAGSNHVSPTQSIDKPINLSVYTISEQAKEHKNIRQKTSKGQYHAKNLVTERNRRNRIRDSLYALRALVPNISKMDKTSIVGDAIDYIEELQTNVKELQEELERLEEDDSKSHLDEIEVCKPKKAHIHSPTKGHSLVSTTSNRKTEVQVEVHQIGAKGFLLKLVCGEQRGGFRRIMETVDFLGLQVLDVNVTTCYGKVLNILKVEAKRNDFAAKSLKDSLLDRWWKGRMLDDNSTKSD